MWKPVPSPRPMPISAAPFTGSCPSGGEIDEGHKAAKANDDLPSVARLLHSEDQVLASRCGLVPRIGRRLASRRTDHRQDGLFDVRAQLIVPVEELMHTQNRNHGHYCTRVSRIG